MNELKKLNKLTLDEFKEEAAKLGYRTRVVEQDGKHLIVTRDLRSNRVNVAVNGGIVTVKNIG